MGNIFSLCCGAGSKALEQGQFEQDDVDGRYQMKYVTDKALINEDFNREAELITSIKRSIGNYVRDGKKFYIGICSGTNREGAMERRVDDYKERNNLNKMVTLFEADDQQTVRNIEGQLIHYYLSTYTGNGNCINRAEGGGGRNSKGPKYQVYIAIEE